MKTRRASCSCGQLSVTCEGEPVRISICHCHECQRRTGSAFGVQARFPHERVTIQGRSTVFTRVGGSGGRITFHFCPACGATMHYMIDAMPGVVGIPVGAFADAGFPPPKFSVYEARKHPWVVVPDAIEHHD
jgi:hypothetical protein